MVLMSYLLVVVLPGEVEETGWGEELIVGEGKPLHCGSACRQEESLEEFLRCRSLEMWSASTSASLSSSLAVLCSAVLSSALLSPLPRCCGRYQTERRCTGWCLHRHVAALSQKHAAADCGLQPRAVVPKVRSTDESRRVVVSSVMGN